MKAPNLRHVLYECGGCGRKMARQPTLELSDSAATTTSQHGVAKFQLVFALAMS